MSDTLSEDPSPQERGRLIPLPHSLSQTCLRASVLDTGEAGSTYTVASAFGGSLLLLLLPPLLVIISSRTSPLQLLVVLGRLRALLRLVDLVLAILREVDLQDALVVIEPERAHRRQDVLAVDRLALLVQALLSSL